MRNVVFQSVAVLFCYYGTSITNLGFSSPYRSRQRRQTSPTSPLRRTPTLSLGKSSATTSGTISTTSDPVTLALENGRSQVSKAISNDDVESSSAPCRLSYQLHLLSLEWSSLDESTTTTTTTTKFSKATSDLWKWKDAILGDGRDFFIPRPRTLQALQQYLLRNDMEEKDGNNFFEIQECMIVSNCARFEILLVTTTTTCTSNNNTAATSSSGTTTEADCDRRSVEERISRRLMAQCRAHQQREQKSNPFATLSNNLPFDRPSSIFPNPPLLDQIQIGLCNITKSKTCCSTSVLILSINSSKCDRAFVIISLPVLVLTTR